MDKVPKVKKAIKANKCLFGTIDTWILWVGLFRVERSFSYFNCFC